MRFRFLRRVISSGLPPSLRCPQGYHHTSLVEPAQDGNIRKPSIHAHFTSREKSSVAILEVAFKREKLALPPLTQAGTPPEEALRVYFFRRPARSAASPYLRFCVRAVSMPPYGPEKEILEYDRLYARTIDTYLGRLPEKIEAGAASCAGSPRCGTPSPAFRALGRGPCLRRSILSIVISLVFTLAGSLAIIELPVARYPELVPHSQCDSLLSRRRPGHRPRQREQQGEPGPDPAPRGGALPGHYACQTLPGHAFGFCCYAQGVRYGRGFPTDRMKISMGSLCLQPRSNGIATGERVAAPQWSARLPLAGQDGFARALSGRAAPVNIINFSPGSVLPAEGTGGEPMYSFDCACRLARE